MADKFTDHLLPEEKYVLKSLGETGYVVDVDCTSDMPAWVHGMERVTPASFWDVMFPMEKKGLVFRFWWFEISTLYPLWSLTARGRALYRRLAGLPPRTL